jgi:heat shock protein HslJ
LTATLNILGTWIPRTIFGREVLESHTAERGQATIKFHDAGRWIGMDGCNWTYGAYRFDANGTFRAEASHQTLRACNGIERVQNVEVLTGASQVRTNGRMLEFVADNREVIGLYARSEA